MKGIRFKYCLVLLFLFTVLERSGIAMYNLITSDHISYEQVIAEAENTGSKDSENNKDNSLKEYWNVSHVFQLEVPLAGPPRTIQIPDLHRVALLFFLSVPTPPPDHC